MINLTILEDLKFLRLPGRDQIGVGGDLFYNISAGCQPIRISEGQLTIDCGTFCQLFAAFVKFK